MPSDTAPLIFEQVLGSLRPVNEAARVATKAVTGRCVAKLTKMTRNQRRRGFFWVMLSVTAEVLSDATDSPWDAESLHSYLKEHLRLGEPLLNREGKEIGFKIASTSDRAMNEADRAAWLERVKRACSILTGVEIVQLMDEVRARGFNEER